MCFYDSIYFIVLSIIIIIIFIQITFTLYVLRFPCTQAKDADSAVNEDDDVAIPAAVSSEDSVTNSNQ